MKKKINDIPEKILTDEAVRFISERHQATVNQVLEFYENLEKKMEIVSLLQQTRL